MAAPTQLRIYLLTSAAFAAFNVLYPATTARAQKYDPPRLPEAVLLVESYLPDRLLLTTEDKTVTLQEDPVELRVSPSISSDGNIVASAHRVPGDLSRAPRLIVSTYSVKDSTWTDHLELEGVWGAVAISPDGSKLACITRDTLGQQLRAHFSLEILDLRTRNVTTVTKASERPGGSLNWSPDGRRIAFDVNPSGHLTESEIRAIYVADIETGTVSQIGIGLSPAWSPSGEWIAYVSYIQVDRAHSQPSDSYASRYYAINDFQISLMSPIGAHSRILMSFHSDVVPNLKPVWSPDSRTLLINKSRNPDIGTFDIYRLDLASGKSAKKFKNNAPVYAWIEAK